MEDTKEFGDLGEEGKGGEGMVVYDVRGGASSCPLSPPLQFPSLCQQFYTLTGYVCELFPEKVVVMPEKLFLTVMSLLEAGVTRSVDGTRPLPCTRPLSGGGIGLDRGVIRVGTYL